MWTEWLRGYALAIKTLDSGISDPFLGQRLLLGQKLSLDLAFLKFYCNGVLLAQIENLQNRADRGCNNS